MKRNKELDIQFQGIGRKVKKNINNWKKLDYKNDLNLNNSNDNIFNIMDLMNNNIQYNNANINYNNHNS